MTVRTADRRCGKKEVVARSEARAALREVSLVALAAVAYLAVRAITEGSADRALANGRRLLRLERALHLDWEQALQAPLLGHPLLLKLANNVYIWGFWPVLAGSGMYLYVRHGEHYVVLRNAVFLSGLIGAVFFALFPVAPPRLVDPHLVDTIQLYSPHYRPAALSDVTNEYASLPSLHFGWILLVSITVAAASRRWIAYALAVVMPTAMALIVLVTANHYVIDVIVGGAVALTALAVAHVAGAAAPPRPTAPGRTSVIRKNGAKDIAGTRAAAGPARTRAPPD